MPDDLDDIIKRTRRVVRLRSEQIDESAAIPPGFADRIPRARGQAPAPTLILWQRLSYVGVVVAGLVSIASALTARDEVEMQFAADSWLEMPMSSLSDEFEIEEETDR